MNSIIITSIICLCLIIITSIICYSNWRNNNGNELEHIHKRIDTLYDRLDCHLNRINSERQETKEYLNKIWNNIKNLLK